MNKEMFKMNPEQLQAWLKTRNKASRIENKKGKGSYKRKDKYSRIAQLAKHLTDNQKSVGSSPTAATKGATKPSRQSFEYKWLSRSENSRKQ